MSFTSARFRFKWIVLAAALAAVVGFLAPSRVRAHEAVANSSSFTLDTTGATGGPACGWFFN